MSPPYCEVTVLAYERSQLMGSERPQLMVSWGLVTLKMMKLPKVKNPKITETVLWTHWKDSFNVLLWENHFFLFFCISNYPSIHTNYKCIFQDIFISLNCFHSFNYGKWCTCVFDSWIYILLPGCWLWAMLPLFCCTSACMWLRGNSKAGIAVWQQRNILQTHAYD